MLPAPFEYHRPQSLDEALSLLDELGEEAKVLAGGMSLIPLMKLRFAAPAHLVDINHIDGLAGIAENDGLLAVGAMTRTGSLETSDLIGARYPAVAAAAPLISDPIIRNRGTIGGSLAHCDPAGDWGSVMLATRAQAVVRSSSGERILAMDDFLKDTFTTSLEPNEILTEIRIPAPEEHSGGTYLKLERKVGDFATVGVAVQVWMGNGHIARAGIALTAVGPRNLRAAAAEEFLEGEEPSDKLFDEAAHLAAGVASPVSDVRGSVDYKRHVAEVFVRRGLARAVEMAKSG
ncbi:MAG TPA: xanthine dehydrogenase family protein subunit M [Actinomycetota bacterium]